MKGGITWKIGDNRLQVGDVPLVRNSDGSVLVTYRPADMTPKPEPKPPAYDPLDHRYKVMRSRMVVDQAARLSRQLGCDLHEVIRRGLALLEAQHHRRH